MKVHEKLSWPPTWITAYPGIVSDIKGAGVLTDVQHLPAEQGQPDRLHLEMKLNGKESTCTLSLNSHRLHSELCEIFHRNIGKSIREIGDLELPEFIAMESHKKGIYDITEVSGQDISISFIDKLGHDDGGACPALHLKSIEEVERFLREKRIDAKQIAKAIQDLRETKAAQISLLG